MVLLLTQAIAFCFTFGPCYCIGFHAQKKSPGCFRSVQSKTEIDFVIDTGRSVIPVEIKYKDLAKPSLP